MREAEITVISCSKLPFQLHQTTQTEWVDCNTPDITPIYASTQLEATSTALIWSVRYRLTVRAPISWSLDRIWVHSIYDLIIPFLVHFAGRRIWIVWACYRYFGSTTSVTKIRTNGFSLISRLRVAKKYD